MNASFDVESTLTDRYQTTVPETVRRALQLGKRDKIHYSIQPDGQVLLTRAMTAEPDADPILAQFLTFIEQDLSRNPQHLQAIDSSLVQRVQALVGAVEIDLDSALQTEKE